MLSYSCSCIYGIFVIVFVNRPEVQRRSEAHEPAECVGWGAAMLINPNLPIGQHNI